LERAAFFGYFFWLLKRSNWIEGIQDKNHQADAARDDGAQRVLIAVLSLENGLR
jgi:hypothetical protein